MSTSEANNNSTDAKNEEPTSTTVATTTTTTTNGGAAIAAMDVLAAAAAGEELAKTDEEAPLEENSDSKTSNGATDIKENGTAPEAEKKSETKDEDGDVEMQQSSPEPKEKKKEEEPSTATEATVKDEGAAESSSKEKDDEDEPPKQVEESKQEDEDTEMKDADEDQNEETKEEGSATKPDEETDAPKEKADDAEPSKPKEEPEAKAEDSEPPKEADKSEAKEEEKLPDKEEEKEEEPEVKADGEASPKKDEPASNGSTEDKRPKDAEKPSDTKAEKPAASSTEKSSSNGAAAQPAPPILRGTLSYNLDQRRHLIRGMWNYDGDNAFPPQRFELVRILDENEDVKELPKDGEFHGSFTLMYYITTSKGKQKERSKVVTESGVKIVFTPIEGKERHYKVDGKGNNPYGVFHINGDATPSTHANDPSYNIVLRKRYEPAPTPSAPAPAENSKKRKIGNVLDSDNESSTLPPPSETFPKNVVALRGKLYKEEGAELGVGDVVHRITGMWSASLQNVLDDPQNARGLCNRFEYEHKSSVPSQQFPISGRYSGGFDLTSETGERSRINEKDVTFKFVKNSEGYYNVEGRGSNVFGKYTITGTLDNDNIITIFRHFQARKLKSSRGVTSAPPPINVPGASRRPSVPSFPEPVLKLEEVKVEDVSSKALEPIKPPETGTYSAVSRGILRVDADGSHTCKGKWAVSREHFTNGQTSSFAFRLEAHFAEEAMKEQGEDRAFPLDSASYKGSFQMKKNGSRYATVVDQQVVMKFRKNKQGSYNVYGRGVNNIGGFTLTGTLIMSGKTGGQVELYRVYPPELLAPQEPEKPAERRPSLPRSSFSEPAPGSLAGLPRPPMVRRESSRMVKAPVRLDEDDPESVMERVMDKCNQILRFMREKDVERGAFFSEPVDPVALGIPTYFQIISEPMDLSTLHKKMEKNEITAPEEFARLSRLIFENAMTFNVDPTHSVHQAARNLLNLFNQKFKDIERMVANVRRTEQEEKGKGKKRKRDEPKSARKMRLEEAQEMAATNAQAMEALVAAAPTLVPTANVTRNEFNLLLDMIGKLQSQVVQTYNAVAELSSDDIESGASITPFDASATSGVSTTGAPAPEKKKHARRKSASAQPVEAPLVYDDDLTPLTLKEQELLTDTINELPAEHLHGVIQIIREAANLMDDEDEIDLEIDQLDTKTQRKLLKHVSKFAKPKKKAKAPRKTTPKSKPASKKNASQPAKKADPDSFFAFGNNDSDNDNDSDEEMSSTPNPAPITKADMGSKQAAFTLGGLGGHSDDEDDDIPEDGIAASWNISKESIDEKMDGDDDDDWGAAREEAAAAKAREEDKKKREEKMQAEAEEAKRQRMADATAKGEEIRAQRMEEEEKEAKIQEQKEKEAEEQRKKIREEARAKAEGLEATVDLDAQRDIMKQYEQSFLDKELGSASPSSDFGF